jgi:hypothetical protein
MQAFVKFLCGNTVGTHYMSAPFVHSGSNKCKQDYSGTYGRGLAESAFHRSLVSGSQLCVWCVWQESGFSHYEDVFTFNVLYKEIMYTSSVHFHVLPVQFAKIMLQ